MVLLCHDFCSKHIYSSSSDAHQTALRLWQRLISLDCQAWAAQKRPASEMRVRENMSEYERKTQNATGRVSRARSTSLCFELKTGSSSPARGHGMLLRHKADSGPQAGTLWLSPSQQHDV